MTSVTPTVSSAVAPAVAPAAITITITATQQPVPSGTGSPIKIIWEGLDAGASNVFDIPGWVNLLGTLTVWTVVTAWCLACVKRKCLATRCGRASAEATGFFSFVYDPYIYFFSPFSFNTALKTASLTYYVL